MSCLHKFHSELNLNEIDYVPNTLIVGTFNPSWPDNNNAQWFYGRTFDENGNQNNNFWDVLPRIYGENSLINASPEEWKFFCRDKGIVITDLIYSINDADPSNQVHRNILGTFSDKDISEKFNDYTYVNIINILVNNPTIQNVYLTRGIGETFWRRLWRPIINYTIENSIYESQLLTPSGYSFYQQGRHNKLNPQNKIYNLSDFVLNKWTEVWHQL